MSINKQSKKDFDTMNNNTKAIVSKIDLGFAQVEGLMLPDGSYAIAVPQIADLFGDTRNYASQSLKRLMGADFKTHKVSTEFNPKPVNIVKLEDFKKIIRLLDKKGNEVASAFMDAILEEGLERRFDHVFNENVKRSPHPQRSGVGMNFDQQIKCD